MLIWYTNISRFLWVWIQ